MSDFTRFALLWFASGFMTGLLFCYVLGCIIIAWRFHKLKGDNEKS